MGGGVNAVRTRGMGWVYFERFCADFFYGRSLKLKFMVKTCLKESYFYQKIEIFVRWERTLSLRRLVDLHQGYGSGNGYIFVKAEAL